MRDFELRIRVLLYNLANFKKFECLKKLLCVVA
jgi:hypothetical protein